MKKLIALTAAILMMLTMHIAAFAADEETQDNTPEEKISITIHRDSTSYEAGGTEENGNRTYTYSYIFRATENQNHTSTGGGYDSDGTPGEVTSTPEKGISYYLEAEADADRIAQLGSWTEGAWVKATGNKWFKLTRSADGSRYTVEWDNEKSDTDTVQEAAQWLKANYTAIKTDTLIASEDGTTWTASDLPEGYYLLQGETGANLIAATADINVNEKNSYPTVDKKQKDAAEDEYTDDPVNVKIGDTLYYQIEVKIPSDANADITVKDTASRGLTYTEDALSVKIGENDLTPDTDEQKNAYKLNEKTGSTWSLTLHTTAETRGQTVVITYAATVNNDALVTVDRKNQAEITYGNYHQIDSVEHDLGAAAILKYDGATADLNTETNALTKAEDAEAVRFLEATFLLKDSKGNPVNVREAVEGTKGVYFVDTTAESNTVTSDKAHNGVILIYGLDPDETYTLTETIAEPGYNLLSAPASIKPVKLEKNNLNATKITVTEAADVFAGDAEAAEENTYELSVAEVSKIENNSGVTLPSTGGIGTTIFYVAGAVLTIGSAVVLITRRILENAIGKE